MKRKFFITEVAVYQVAAETADRAMDEYVTHPNPGQLLADIIDYQIESEKPNPVNVGDQVNVDAHKNHDEDFSGIVVENDGEIGGRIKVKASDGEVYDCDANYVYVPEPSPAVP
jgi:hypothetical protein